MKKDSDYVCPYASKWEDMSEDMKEMKSDIKSLLKFKWQIMGGTSVIVIAISTVIAIIK